MLKALVHARRVTGSMTLTIYGSIGSRASRCLWTAEEAGASYKWVSVSTLDGSNRAPEYLAINPSGRIPAMSDGDVLATESMAINLYIAQNYGQGTLWPEARASQAKVLQWTFWSATEIEYYIGALFRHLVMTPAPQRDLTRIDQLMSEMLPRLDELERTLDGCDYIVGTFSLADVHVAMQTFIMQDRLGLTLSDHPNVAAWTQRCRERPARQRLESKVATSL